MLSLLHEAYEIGSSNLEAPQAMLMSSVAEGVFKNNLEWEMIYIGAFIGIIIILIDQYQLYIKSDFRVPILAVAIGMYLPIQYTIPIFIGGMLNHIAGKTASNEGKNNGLLIASGLITGEALMAIFVAIPLFFNKDIYPQLTLPNLINDLSLIHIS